MPSGARTASRAWSLSGVPVASRVTVSVLTSTTRARNSSAVCSTCDRSVIGARTFTRSSSRWTAASPSSSTILMTSTSLFSCLVICSSGWASASATIVIRERAGFSVGPTARDSMLNPRRLNSAETRARTPDLFSTRTEKVWRGICSLPSDLVVAEDRAHVARGQDLVVAGAGGDHRPHLGVGADDEVDHHGGVVDRHRLLDDRVDVVLALAAQPDAAQRDRKSTRLNSSHANISYAVFC